MQAPSCDTAVNTRNCHGHGSLATVRAHSDSEGNLDFAPVQSSHHPISVFRADCHEDRRVLGLGERVRCSRPLPDVVLKFAFTHDNRNTPCDTLVGLRIL